MSTTLSHCPTGNLLQHPTTSPHTSAAPILRYVTIISYLNYYSVLLTDLPASTLALLCSQNSYQIEGFMI